MSKRCETEISVPLSICLFGNMEVRVRGRPLPHLRSRQSLWILALLALRHPRPVHREWLASMLWPNSEQSRAFSNLRVALSELRAALGEEGRRILTPTRGSLTLDLEQAEVDVLRFDSAVAERQIQELKQAVALYRGPLMQSCVEEWVVPEREAREQDLLRALQQLAEEAFGQADYESAAEYFQRATRVDSFADAPLRGWMEALAKSGNSNEALKVYRDFRSYLRRDDPYGAPDEKTTALYNRLRAQLRARAISKGHDPPGAPDGPA